MKCICGKDLPVGNVFCSMACYRAAHDEEIEVVDVEVKRWVC